MIRGTHGKDSRARSKSNAQANATDRPPIIRCNIKTGEFENNIQKLWDYEMVDRLSPDQEGGMKSA